MTEIRINTNEIHSVSIGMLIIASFCYRKLLIYLLLLFLQLFLRCITGSSAAGAQQRDLERSIIRRSFLCAL